jgi:hypothetical protein
LLRLCAAVPLTIKDFEALPCCSHEKNNCPTFAEVTKIWEMKENREFVPILDGVKTGKVCRFIKFGLCLQRSIDYSIRKSGTF